MSVEFRNTTLEFADADNPSLENFNLLVQPGEKLCISGASGSGKTLLVHLLSGFYDTYSGVIIFNGIPQSSYNLRTLRSHIGDCLTQKLLFRGTIEENLTLGNPNISYQDITRVLDQLGALEEVQQLPQAFQTVITPEGRQLSNTVGRKLILAKCALKKPQLLLMDNFLSSLAGEEQVRIGRFVTSNPDWTLVAISNNPRFAAMCDRVVVMDGGKIADVGPLEELASKPYYSKIFGATPTA
jgi:ABC-type multidrug transport system fused ATPase/permease subunit